MRRKAWRNQKGSFTQQRRVLKTKMRWATWYEVSQRRKSRWWKTLQVSNVFWNENGAAKEIANEKTVIASSRVTARRRSDMNTEPIFTHRSHREDGIETSCDLCSWLITPETENFDVFKFRKIKLAISTTVFLESSKYFNRNSHLARYSNVDAQNQKDQWK